MSNDITRDTINENDLHLVHIDGLSAYFSRDYAIISSNPTTGNEICIKNKSNPNFMSSAKCSGKTVKTYKETSSDFDINHYC